MGKASHKKREKLYPDEWDRQQGETALQWRERVVRQQEEDHRGIAND